MGIGLLGASPVLLLFLLGYCLAVIDGELRCYCNESGCVSTGYMCKSSVGMCFTSIDAGPHSDSEDIVRPHSTHGCLDSLPPRHRMACQPTGLNNIVVNPAVAATSSSSSSGAELLSSASSASLLAAGAAASPTLQNKLPLLLCCSEHMCNYVEDTADGASINNQHHPAKKTNGTLFQGKTFSKKDKAVSKNQGSHRDDDRDLWFKAAVIAVPIAGGFILVLLVLLAVRMLRTDSRHHRRLIQIHQDRNSTNAHMYISDHFAGGKKHQCSLFNEKTGKICSILYPPPPPETSTTRASATNHKTVQKPIYNPSSNKNPPHRYSYIGLFSGDNTKLYYNERNKKLKDSGGSDSSPPPKLNSSCDKFFSSTSCSNSNSKNNSSCCCKQNCGKNNSNISINSSTFSDNHVYLSSQESLSNKGNINKKSGVREH